MVEATAVVLLFDDAELGGQLRVALLERGANIVHEGGLSDLSRDLFVRVGADVVVISFGDEDDDAFERMDKAIDGDHPRVVINDAQASRGLEGWDRARWARHLAVKVLAEGDTDPARPESAPAPEMVAAAEEMASAGETTAAATVADEVATEAMVDEPVVAGDHQEREIAAESESLEAELEALLSGDPMPAVDEVGSGLNYAIGDAPSQLHDGNFLDAVVAEDAGNDLDEGIERQLAGNEPPAPPAREPEPPAPAPSAPKFSLDSLSLVDLDAAGPPPLPEVPDAAKAAAPAARATPTHQAPDSWSLVDPDSDAADADASGADEAVSTKPDPAEFGIEKLSASDFLAPDGDKVAADFEPTMTLELVSMAEAVAPQPFEASDQDMLPDSLGGALTRLVLLGATVDSIDSVCEFLSTLPADMRATIVHVQHLGPRSTDELAQHLAKYSALPLRIAQNGQLARAGEILLVPPESELRLTRDGKVDLSPAQDMGASSPSIDTTFTAAASSFGRDALAILFAGQANDAVAGCQAIHDRGGRVWVEESSGAHFADMVSGVMTEQLADFSGAPAALAARLVEEY